MVKFTEEAVEYCNNEDDYNRYLMEAIFLIDMGKYQDNGVYTIKRYNDICLQYNKTYSGDSLTQWHLRLSTQLPMGTSKENYFKNNIWTPAISSPLFPRQDIVY